MICILCCVAVIDDDIINYATKSREPCKGFVRSAIVVKSMRFIQCTKEFESPEWSDACCQHLALVQWTLVITFHGVYFCEDFCLVFSNVGNILGKGGQLIPLLPDILV